MIAALATLPGLGVGTLWDNSETAYGEVAREILLTHQLVVLHLNGVPWFVQPPLYFWIAAAFAKALGVSPFALRLPSALATIATAGAVGYAAARVVSPRAALLAATILSTSLMQAVVGRLAIMDALLDLAVAVAILAFFGALQREDRRLWYAAWAALAVGLLAKGIVAPAITALVVIPWALSEKYARGRVVVPGVAGWLGGIVLCAAIIAPWAVALWRLAGADAFAQMVGHYTVGRYLGTIENQSGPVWYYVPVVILGFFPWSAFLVPALADGWRAARLNGSGGAMARLAFAWSALPFLFFSFADTKLPNYIALELPALALLVAVWFDRIVERRDRRVALAWTAIVPVTIVGLGFAMAAFSHDNRLTADLQAIRLDFIALGCVILLGSIVCFGLLLARRLASFAPFSLAASSVLVMLIIAVFGEPIVERFKPIPTLAAVIDRDRRPGDVVAIQGVSGGNALLFYTRPRVAKLAEPTDGDPGLTSDPRSTICRAQRAFVVTSKQRPSPDPTYGRRRQTLAVSNKDVLFLYDGPPCTTTMSRR